MSLRLFILPLAVVLAGCRGSHGLVLGEDNLKKDSGTSQQVWKLNGIDKISMPVTVTQSSSGDTLRVSIATHGEDLEHETYRLNDAEFDLVSSDSDKFAPAIPLLKFPSSPGASWDWKGELEEGSMRRKATAHIGTSLDKVRTAAGFVPAEKVLVKLAIDSGTPVPSQRELSFWFTEQDGLVQREFGAGSARGPAVPGSE